MDNDDFQPKPDPTKHTEDGPALSYQAEDTLDKIHLSLTTTLKLVVEKLDAIEELLAEVEERLIEIEMGSGRWGD